MNKSIAAYGRRVTVTGILFLLLGSLHYFLPYWKTGNLPDPILWMGPVFMALGLSGFVTGDLAIRVGSLEQEIQSLRKAQSSEAPGSEST